MCKMQTYYKTVYINRHPSFITVQIEDMENLDLRKKRLDSALVKIDKESVLNDMIILYYNLLKLICGYIYISTIYIKTFKILQLNVYANDTIYRFYKDMFLKINDDKMFINVSQVPYEYIITFVCNEEYIFMELFAKTKVIDKKLKLLPSDKKIQLILRFASKELATKICQLMRQNMYYHIKYNKIDENVIDYFMELEKQQPSVPTTP
jgi:hypothetical protein